jgi:hypothetical protein
MKQHDGAALGIALVENLEPAGRGVHQGGPQITDVRVLGRVGDDEGVKQQEHDQPSDDPEGDLEPARHRRLVRGVGP